MPPIHRTAVIILAAGASRRLGRAKQQVTFEGETLLRRAVLTALASGVGPVYVVLASGDAASVADLRGMDVSVVENPSADRGIGTSIRAGIHALPDFSDSVLLMLVDQTRIDADLLARLALALRESPDAVAAACRYGGSPGVPAVFRREVFGQLLALPDGSGAKSLLAEWRGRVVEIAFPAAAWDVDVPDDLASLSRPRAKTNEAPLRRGASD